MFLLNFQQFGDLWNIDWMQLWSILEEVILLEDTWQSVLGLQ